MQLEPPTGGGGTAAGHAVVTSLSQIIYYVQKFAQYVFGNFPKFLPIMLFMLPIMLVLCSNMNNTDAKILLFECSIRVFTI